MNNWYSAFILLLSICFSVRTGAQITYYPVDSNESFLLRTNKKVVNYYLGEGSPVPKRSVLYSMILPGAGQIYNRQAWKIGLIYGGYGALIKNLADNRDLYRRFDTAFRRSVAGEPHEFEDFNLGSEALRSYRDQYLRNIELTYIGMGAVYIVTLLDAFVSAHLSTFDVSEDLSIYIPPTSPLSPFQLGLAYSF